MAIRPLNDSTRASMKRRLSSIPSRVKAAASAYLEKAAEGLVDQMKAGVTNRSGDLARSIHAYEVNDEAGIGQRIAAGGHGSEAFYAAFVEFGTKAAPGGRYQDAKGKTRTNKRPHAATAPHPFFFPVYRRNKRRIRSGLTKAIGAAVHSEAE